MSKKWFLIGIFLAATLLLPGCGKRNDATTEENTSEDSLLIQDTEEDTEEIMGFTGLDIADEYVYSSLYGTGPSMTLTDEEYIQLSGAFIGEAEATDDIVTGELERLHSLMSEGRMQQFYTSIQAFSQAYTLVDSDASRELALLYGDCVWMKDLNNSVINEDWTFVTDMVNKVRDVEGYLRCVGLSTRSYLFSLDNNSISLSGNPEIVGTAQILPESDKRYDEARNLVDNPRVIYRFTILYNEETAFYAYVVACKDQTNHLLYVENTDGSFLSPQEKEEDIDYQAPIEIIHNSDYDEGAWDNDTVEPVTEEIDEDLPETEITE